MLQAVNADFIEEAMKTTGEIEREKETAERDRRKTDMFAACMLDRKESTQHGFTFPITDK